MSLKDLIYGEKDGNVVHRDDFDERMSCSVGEDYFSPGPSSSGVAELYTLSLTLSQTTKVDNRTSGMEIVERKRQMAAAIKRFLYKDLEDKARLALSAVANGNRRQARNALSELLSEIKSKDDSEAILEHIRKRG